MPAGAFADDSPGEWPGTLGGTYHHGGGSVPYHATRVPLGLGISAVAGVISGMAGVGGSLLGSYWNEAVDPDVLMVNEVWNSSANDVRNKIEQHLPSGPGEQWYALTEDGNNVIVAYEDGRLADLLDPDQHGQHGRAA